MPKVTGQVKALARSGKALMIGELWYSDRYGIKGIDRGDTITFECRVNGDFNNITSKIEKTESAAPSAANSSTGGSGRGSIEVNILASHSINCAVELAKLSNDTSLSGLEGWVEIIYQLNLSTRKKIIAGELDKETVREVKPVDEESPFNN